MTDARSITKEVAGIGWMTTAVGPGWLAFFGEGLYSAVGIGRREREYY